MASILSYVPIVNRLVTPRNVDKKIDVPGVVEYSIETEPEKRPRTLKHLLRANHVNHSVIYHNLQYDNHLPHILCSAYILGAQPAQLHHIYEEESKSLEPWQDSPSEVIQDDWRDFLGDKRYQRAFVDFFEDALAMKYSYDWKKVVEEYILGGDEPLVNGLIGGLGHPLIHLGFAFEFDNREVAIEAMAMAASQYNFLHKYTDDPSYTKKSPFSSTSPTELLEKLAGDKRFDGMFKEPGFENIERLFEGHESLVLEYWNAWDLSNPSKQFKESQDLAIALLAATVPPGAHSYNFFLVHILTTNHAVKVLLHFLPAKFHISLVRQWWLLTLAVYVAELRPKVDPDNVPIPDDIDKKGWKYVVDKALISKWSTDAHFVKAIRSISEVERSWGGDAQGRYLASAIKFVDEFKGPIRKNSTAPSLAPAASSTSKQTIGIQSRLFAGSRPTTKSPSTSPDKRQTTRGSKKLKIDDKEKGKSADLKTLFSNQAQRSRNSVANASSSNKNAPNTLDFDDIISDPISDDDDLALHKTASSSSIVGKTAIKRFKESSQSQSQSGSNSVVNSQRFLMPPKLAGSGTTAKTETKVPIEDLRPWSERFGPLNLDELAVHKRKVADVRKWLEDVLAGRMRQRLLVLKGAAGTGKTTTVQLLAKDLRCEILEWRNPANSYGAGVQGYQSASAQFEEFLGRGGRFGQLDVESSDEGSPAQPPPSTNASTLRGQERRLILIEEFPNTFMRSSTGLTSFRNAILQFLAANTPSLMNFARDPSLEPITPIVMVISETLLTTTSASADSFTAHRLLGPEILRHPGTGVIEFNPIAPTLLAKALEIVVQKEARKSGRRKTPGPLVLKRLGDIGDIRSAISALEFLCVKGDDDADWGAKIAFTKPKRGSKDTPALTKGEQDSLELVSQREATLGIFHAVGKVVYNKRGEPAPQGSVEAAAEKLPCYMSHLARPPISEVNVDTLIDETGTDTHTFISALHENFPLSCEPSGPSDHNSAVDYLNGCLDNLSDSDMLCPSWDVFFGGRGGGGGGYFAKDSGSHILRQDEMAFQVAVRGLLFSLPSPVKRQKHPTGRGGDSFKMFYPAYLKLWRAKEELEGLVDMWSTKMLRGEDGTSRSNGSTTSLTSGASAFRKTKPMNGTGGSSISVGDWASPTKRRQSQSQAQSQAETNSTTTAPPPLLSLGNSARQEMLLERLPYMAHIARRRRCSFGTMKIKDLEKIVSFQGIGPAKTEDSEPEDDDDGTPVVTGGGGGIGGGEDSAAWATDKPTEEGTPRKKKRTGLTSMINLGKTTAKKRGGVLGQYEEDEDGLNGIENLPVQSLVLSDDDIEDDF
ncbi:cell cycle checkpoint protein RAD17 [Naviculisporaceae sp. PSN 640]